VTHILFFGIIIVWCVIWALIEIHVEGRNGWAKNAPTWKYKLDEAGKLLYKPFGVSDYQQPTCSERRQKFLRWCIKYKCGGRELTGYHCLVDIMQVFVGHMTVYLSCGSIAAWWLAFVLELRVVAFVLLAWSIEDTLWFRLNPFYKSGELIPEWHKDWWLFASKGMIKLSLQGCAIYAATCIAMFFLNK
jgi:hypothetical protein